MSAVLSRCASAERNSRSPPRCVSARLSRSAASGAYVDQIARVPGRMLGRGARAGFESERSHGANGIAESAAASHPLPAKIFVNAGPCGGYFFGIFAAGKGLAGFNVTDGSGYGSLLRRQSRATVTRNGGRETTMRMFQVCVCGQPLQCNEAPTPQPAGTEVLLKVLAAGVCHSDLHLGRRLVRSRRRQAHEPRRPWHEAAGDPRPRKRR